MYLFAIAATVALTCIALIGVSVTLGAHHLISRGRAIVRRGPWARRDDRVPLTFRLRGLLSQLITRSAAEPAPGHRTRDVNWDGST